MKNTNKLLFAATGLAETIKTINNSGLVKNCCLSFKTTTFDLINTSSQLISKEPLDSFGDLSKNNSEVNFSKSIKAVSICPAMR